MRENPILSSATARDAEGARFDALGFFDRMRAMRRLLGKTRKLVTAKYDKKRARKRPWLNVLDKLEHVLRFVLAQERSEAPSIVAANGLVFGLPFAAGGWAPLAKGNSKLSFVAYSELPMATCPGAGQCGVPYAKFELQDAAERAREARNAAQKALNATLPVKQRKKLEPRGGALGGWCYSFKAFRYPDAFARQWLNTMAAYADREFAIIAGGGRHVRPDDHLGRVNAALAGNSSRLWPGIVANLAVTMTRAARGVKTRTSASGAPTTVFMRLFVDGDINYEDNVIAWMRAVAQIGPGGAFLTDGGGHVEVYGYSKAWSAFANVDRYVQGEWPVNYTVNLSSGSVYAATRKRDGSLTSAGEAATAIRKTMEALPISRGYFEAIPLHTFIPMLQKQAELLRADPRAVVPMPTAPTPVPISAERVRGFLLLNTVSTVADVEAVMPGVRWPRAKNGALQALPEEKVRHLAYDHFLRSLLADPEFGARVRRELARDANPKAEDAYLDQLEARQRERLASALGGGRRGREPFAAKRLTDKALALVLHETLWSYGLGGSCPLVCGNCSDHPTDAKLGVHRCASKSTFKDKTIRIGLH